MNKTEDEKEPKSRSTNASEAFDSLLSSVGNCGKWQIYMVFLGGLCGVFVAFPSQGAIFLAATPDHLCDLPFEDHGIENSFSSDEIHNYTTPWVTGKDGTPKLSECLYYDRNYDLLTIQNLAPEKNSSSAITIYENNGENPDTIKCSSWKYDQSIFNSTIVTEWNLVCDDQWKKPSIQSTYMLGFLIGGLFASAFSDRFGRRPATIACALIFMASIIVTSFSNSLALFMFFRFMTGGAGIGMYLINFVFVMETCGMKYRNLIGHFHVLSWVVGYFWLILMAYLLRDWKYLQLSISIPSLLLLCYIWLLPESPRWLLMKGRTEEGLELLRKIGKMNGGKELPEKEEVDHALKIIEDEILKDQEKKSTSIWTKLTNFCKDVFSLVHTPKMRRRSLVIFFNWFVVSMSYYGVSFSGENIEVSLYVMALIGALVDFPGTYYAYMVAIKFGRRITLSTSMCLAGVCCFTILLVPTHIGWLKLTLALAGRMFLQAGFTSVFIFSTELVPTNIRNISIGLGSMHARIGSSLAPFIVDLLGQIYYAIPSTIFGILSLLAGLLALLLPETSGIGLPESIEQIERMEK